MRVIRPEWVATYEASRLQRDFELALEVDELSCMIVKRWLDRFGKGEISSLEQSLNQ